MFFGKKKNILIFFHSSFLKHVSSTKVFRLLPKKNKWEKNLFNKVERKFVYEF